MADIQKPVVAPTDIPVETTAAPVVPVAAEPSTEPVTKVEDAVKPEGETPAVAAVAEEKKEETKKEEKPVEPILSGALKYKGPGLKNAFLFSTKYFWFSDEPVSVQDLNDYLRGEKADVAHPTAAWSSQTGKGLLYFVKHADKKDKPAGVLNLADGTDLIKDGTTEFHLKVHGHKHTFQAKTSVERNGWFLAFQNAVEAGKAEKETITESEAYKAELEKLGKPAALAATAAKEGSTPKKSIETPKPAETTATEPVVAESSTVPPRTASSSSSSSSDEDKKKKKKSKSTSRSVSRGKRASIFGSFLGKKDKAEEKAEEKKEEHDAKKAEETPAVAPIADASSTTAPVIPATEEPVKAAEVPKTEEPVVAVPAATTEDKVEEKPKAAKRGSVFGFIDKLRSPTTEKKEADLLPAPAAKETETTAAAPKLEETPVVAAPVIAPLDVAAETPKTEETKVEAPKTEEAKPAATTPHKEKQSFSFGKFLGSSKDKVKSPTTEKSADKALETPAAKTEEPAKVEETPAPVVAADPTPVEPVAAETTKEETTPESTPAGKKRGSIFGNLIRSASKAGRSKKEKEVTATPAKVEETAEPTEETPAIAATEEKKEETPVVPAASEPATIGDVVPDAVTVGQAPKSTPQVSSTA